MTLQRLAWTHLWAKPLAALLNLLLLTLGFAAISLVLLVSEQLEQRMHRDLAGIDLVVGAKGSPLQLILAGVFHLDAPPGNIPLEAVQTLAGQPLVARVIPLSLGDTLRGFRIVGTTPDYPSLYGATLASGREWAKPLEAVLGSEVADATALGTGATFAGSHGLGGSGELHADTPYTVVGVYQPTGTVLDRLVLTSTESVWSVHELATANDAEDLKVMAAEREVTMLLVTYRSPLAAATLPRWVNSQPELQAASPALETARLLRMVGVGIDVLKGFGAVLLLVAALSVFIALYHAVRERENDLAMMRMLGAPAKRVAGLVAGEALWLVAIGAVLGISLGHLLTHLLGFILRSERSVSLSGTLWSVWEWSIPIMAIVLALLSSALPVWRAYRLDVTRLLQAPR